MLVSMKKYKEGQKCIKEFNLNPERFPKIIEQSCFSVAGYFASLAYKKKTDHDYMTFFKLEDLFGGD